MALFQKGHNINKGRIPWNKGKPFSKESREKMSAKSKRPRPWKYKATAGYSVIHQWVSRWKGKPQNCEDCGRTEPPAGLGKVKSYFQWANVSGLYKRDLADWRRLCRKCHASFDAARRKAKRKKIRY